MLTQKHLDLIKFKCDVASDFMEKFCDTHFGPLMRWNAGAGDILNKKEYLLKIFYRIKHGSYDHAELKPMMVHANEEYSKFHRLSVEYTKEK